MDAFVTTHTSSKYEGANGAMTMGYYKREDLAFYYALADAFTLCDGYHCSILGPTHPNRLMANSGTIDPGGPAGRSGDRHQRHARHHLGLHVDDDAGGAPGRRDLVEGLQPEQCSG